MIALFVERLATVQLHSVNITNHVKRKKQTKTRIMERVSNANQLHSGSKIVRVNPFDGRIERLEYVAPHPHHDKYSLFINDNYDGIPKFYNPRLAEEKWYHFHDTKEEWDELIKMRYAYHKKEIEKIEEYWEKSKKP